MEIIRLIVGDWSDDGHGKTDVIRIKSNLSQKKLAKAYDKGTKKVGYNFMNEVAAEYEDGTISHNQYTRLKELGFDKYEIETSFWYDKKDKTPLDKRTYSISPSEYADLLLFICKLGDKSFEYEEVEDDSDSWTIGGYGLL